MTFQMRHLASRIVLRILTRSTSKLKYSYKYLLLFFFRAFNRENFPFNGIWEPLRLILSPIDHYFFIASLVSSRKNGAEY